MAETDLTTAQADALSGTTDGDTDLKYPTIGESTYYTTMYRLIHRLLTLSKPAGNSLRVYKDGELTFGVRPGRYMDGDTARDYAGASGQALTNDQTNYIYLTANGTLTVNTTGFPNPSATPHIPLAAVTTSEGSYSHDDITDYRPRALLGVLTGIAAADLQDSLPELQITVGAESGDDRQITVQVRDAGGNDLVRRVLVRLWIATSNYGPPDAAGNTVTVDTGTTVQTISANAHYLVESDADGQVQLTLTVSGAASRYVLAELDGAVYSSGEITYSA